MSTPFDPTTLLETARKGSVAALASAISIAQISDSNGDRLLSAAYACARSASIIGITGPPGAGKSTLVDSLLSHFKGQNRVAALLVDPASPISGGALLGDRIRMSQHAADHEVFIRSLSNQGRRGGIGPTTGKVTTVLEAAGRNPIFIETVGVGQSEFAISELATTTVVVLAPGWGDHVQAAKAGILEQGDIYVVNKADLEGAHELVQDLRRMVAPSQARTRSAPVVLCSAITGEGLTQLLDELVRHEDHLRASGELGERRRRRIVGAVKSALATDLEDRIAAMEISSELMAQLEDRTLDPWGVAKMATRWFADDLWAEHI